jgi:hypothetical protein
VSDGAAASNTHDYDVFGLSVRSEVELPELHRISGAGAPDVVIRRGDAGGPAEASPGLHAEGEALVLVVAGVARFRIANGSSITVQPVAGVPERNIRLFLLGSAFGALLHQRGALPLHANAIEIDGRAIAFMGESGAGKSTLAAWFHDRGYPILADDVCVVRLNAEGRALAYPGLPRLRLWEDALDATGRRSADYPQSFFGDEDFRKYDVSISRNAARAPVELGAVFMLARGEGVSVEKLGGIDAVTAVFDHTYRGAFLDRTHSHQAHWSAALDLVRHVPLFTLTRAWNIDRLDEQCELILQTVRESGLRA